MPHAERDRQFRYLNETAKRFLPGRAGDFGRHQEEGTGGGIRIRAENRGRRGEAPQPQVHDFPSLGKGTAIPYGAYDVYRNEGW